MALGTLISRARRLCEQEAVPQTPERPQKGFSTAAGGVGRHHDYGATKPVFVRGQRVVFGKTAVLEPAEVTKEIPTEDSRFVYLTP